MHVSVLIFAGFGANHELACRPLLDYAREMAMRLGDESPFVLQDGDGLAQWRDRLCQSEAAHVLFLQADRVVLSEERLATLLPVQEQGRYTQFLKSNRGACMAARMDRKTLTDVLGKTKANVSSLDGLIKLMQEQGAESRMQECDGEEAFAIDNPARLAQAEAAMQQRLRKRALLNGACLQDPGSVHFSFDTRLEADVFVEPFVVFAPGVRVGRGARIRAFSHLEGCTVAPLARIGPYARLRPQSRIGEGARIGNFVEVKQADVGADARISHLAYIGDARVGARANIGAGAITCNYDGIAKHRTEIGEDAFIGSNSSLVAPVRIGKGAYVGSGSTITEDVQAEALALARARQSAYPGRARRSKATGKDGKKDGKD